MKWESTGKDANDASHVYSNIRFFLFFLGLGLLPLDVGSIITACRDQVLLFIAVFVESNPGNMLWVTCKSSTVLCVLQNWRLVDTHGTEVVTSGNKRFIMVEVGRVDVCSISTRWEHTGDFPTKLACCSFPNVQINKRSLALSDLLLFLDIVEQLCVSLIYSSQVLRVFRPVHGCDCRWMYERDGPVKWVAFLIDLVDVDWVIMGTNSQELLIWRVDHDFAPLTRLVKGRDSLRKVIVV